MLRLTEVDAFYGKSQALHGLSIEIGAGEAIGLLGRNGAGKTTTLRAIMGLVAARGEITFDDRPLIGLPTHRIARLGISLVAEHRGVLATLSVEENLQIALRRSSVFGIADALRLFPRLGERRRNSAANLSGGEQQMLAIARGLLGGPRLLILDEPTQGLAPVIVEEIVRALGDIRQQGLALLLVEQNLAMCLSMAERHYILEDGRIVCAAASAELAASPHIRERYLGVAPT